MSETNGMAMNFATRNIATRHATREAMKHIHIKASGSLSELTCEETGVAANDEQSLNGTDFPADVGKFERRRKKLWKHSAQFHCHILVYPADEKLSDTCRWVVILLETMRL